MTSETMRRALAGLQKKRAKERPAIEERVRAAHHFSATIFLRGSYLTRRALSLEEARGFRCELEAEAANYRRAMVYAVSREGFTHLVPDWFEEGLSC